MSAFGGPPKSPTPTPTPPRQTTAPEATSTSTPKQLPGPAQDSSTPTRTRTERSSSRPMSLVQAYQPPLMEIAQDTLPELQPIFTFLNSHSNKLYQEGYFLKLNDLDSRMWSIDIPWRLAAKLFCRGTTTCRPIMGRVLCPTSRHSVVVVGCSSTRRGRSRRGGCAEVHQSGRCLNKNGTLKMIMPLASNK